MDIAILAAQHIKAILDLVKQEGAPDKIVLATYNREEYAELHRNPNDMSYEDHQELVKAISEALVDFNISDRVVFQEIDSVEYYRWLAKRGLTDSDASRATFASAKYDNIQDKLRMPKRDGK